MKIKRSRVIRLGRRESRTGIVGFCALAILSGAGGGMVATDNAVRSHLDVAIARPDVVWHRNFGPDRGVLEMRVSGSLLDEVVVAAHTNGDLDDRPFSFVGSFDPITGEPVVRHGVTSVGRWPEEVYWDFDAGTGPGGSPDFLVAVGIANPSDDWDDITDDRGFIDIFRDKRFVDRSRGYHWNLARRLDTEFFQILAVSGLDPVAGRFLIGTGVIRSNDVGGGYDAILAAYDLEGREIWREVMSNGGVINIHDMVVSGGRLYVVGSVTRYFEGTEPIGGNDGFIRAYRLARPATGGEVRAEHLWTRRFLTGWATRSPEEVRSPDTRSGLLVAAADRAGNVYVAGYSEAFLPDRLPDELDMHPLGGFLTSFVLKYDPEGRHGWTKQFGASAATAVRAITTDCRGNLWLGGATMGVFGREHQRGDEPHGGFVVRLDPDGNTTWASSSILAGRLGDVDAGWYYVSGLDLDPEGRLFAVGSYLHHWGWQPSRGNAGFITLLRDPVPHTVGGDGFARCPVDPGPTPPANGGQCVQTPDASVLVLPGGTSVPHEGFGDEPACSNNIDDDNDGLCDAVDPDCRTTRREYDGTTGCIPLGPDIAPAAERFPSPLCSDGIDNDGNGRCDHMEPQCRAPSPVEERIDKIPGPVFLPPTLNPRACQEAVQGRIAWNYSGNKSWNSDNVERLCAGAETSIGPARCFERVMHGGINHGSGTRWEWPNALNLCEGTQDADATIACFQSRIASGLAMRPAIDACETR